MAAPLLFIVVCIPAVFESAERSLGPQHPHVMLSPLRYRKCPLDIYFTFS